jgi:demethylphylloquinone reductase
VANVKSKVVILGGGFGGLFTALELKSYDVTLVSRENHFLFTPLLYEYMSGEAEAWQVAPEYSELVDPDDMRVVRGEGRSIDFNTKEVELFDGARLKYDAIVIAVGGATNYANVDGAELHAIPFRTKADADALRLRMIQTLDSLTPQMTPDEVAQRATFAITGAGASGVEVSLKMSDLLRQAFDERKLQGAPRILILEMGERILPNMDDGIRAYAEEALKNANVEIITAARVMRVTADHLRYAREGHEEDLQVAAVVWTAGVKINPLVEALPVEKDRRGLILVEPTLQIRGQPHAFALGDIALFPNVNPRLAGTAQLANQQAKTAASNIRALLEGQPLEAGHFEELGAALGLGTHAAAVNAGDFIFGGALGRQARFALYTTRLPTWQHRLRVGASWFLGGKAPEPLGAAARK